MKRQLFWKEACKFLAGGFFVTWGASWYLAYCGIAIPFFATTMTPGFLFVRGFIHFFLFLLSLYVGYFRPARLQHEDGPTN